MVVMLLLCSKCGWHYPSVGKCMVCPIIKEPAAKQPTIKCSCSAGYFINAKMWRIHFKDSTPRGSQSLAYKGGNAEHQLINYGRGRRRKVA